MENSELKQLTLREHLLEGQVIPACPLALTGEGQWSESHQAALVRYYHASGAGGLAVGVHSTQFAIRRPEIGLYEPLLRQVAGLRKALPSRTPSRPFTLIAGVCGSGESALGEARLAASLGYEAALLSPSGWADQPESAFLEHCRSLADIIPIIGFYLQPSVGGRLFSPDFWCRLAEIPNLVAIKAAPFNRYRTLDVARGLMQAGREDVALYTGNDDNIVFDLLTTFRVDQKVVRIQGGLLGQWGVWTSKAVELLEQIKKDRAQECLALDPYQTLNTALTDANAVIFDAVNDFKGCIPGIMEVLRRQGLVPSNRCLDPLERLSPGQREELDRIHREYPFLNDDDFVQANLDHWMA